MVWLYAGSVGSILPDVQFGMVSQDWVTNIIDHKCLYNEKLFTLKTDVLNSALKCLQFWHMCSSVICATCMYTLAHAQVCGFIM